MRVVVVLIIALLLAVPLAAQQQPAEAENPLTMFNRVNYNNPSSVMSSENFGKYTGAFDPREVEVGMRFQF